MDRRLFLSTSLTVVTAPALAGASALALPVTTRPASPQPTGLSEARFRSVLGSQFRFASDEWRGSLELTEVVSRASDARLEQFTTVFRMNAHARPEPGLYAVYHPDLGRFSLRIDGRRESSVRHAMFALLRG